MQGACGAVVRAPAPVSSHMPGTNTRRGKLVRHSGAQFVSSLLPPATPPSHGGGKVTQHTAQALSHTHHHNTVQTDAGAARLHALGLALTPLPHAFTPHPHTHGDSPYVWAGDRGRPRGRGSPGRRDSSSQQLVFVPQRLKLYFSRAPTRPPSYAPHYAPNLSPSNKHAQTHAHKIKA